jgi:hypothetical protein
LEFLGKIVAEFTAIPKVTVIGLARLVAGALDRSRKFEDLSSRIVPLNKEGLDEIVLEGTGILEEEIEELDAILRALQEYAASTGEVIDRSCVGGTVV